jgi:hypothetical protein
MAADGSCAAAAQECMEPLEAGWSQPEVSPEPTWESQPDNTLVLDIWPPDLCENNCLF